MDPWQRSDAHYNSSMESNTSPPLDPLGRFPIDPIIAALPKADIHLHQEWSPRLDRVLARKDGRPAYDWVGWVRELMAETPPGMPRLAQLASVFPAPLELDAELENVIARLEDALEEGAADGAILVEVRFGGATALLQPNFMDLFREAERRVCERYPRLRAEAIYTLLMQDETERRERVVSACLRAARAGLSGIDVLYAPYAADATWQPMYEVAARAVDAGLGITAHAGEFSTANIEAALRMPGLTRLGHATCAASDSHLLDLIGERGITVECCLTSNVILGATTSYEAHPIRTFVEHGISVALCTDDPVQLATTIGREYALAHALGLSYAQLVECSANAIRASFAPPERKAALLSALRGWC